MSFQLPSGPVPRSLIPYAGRVDSQRLLSVVAIPFAAAIAMATAVAAMGGVTDPIAEAGGPMTFVLNFVKFCYLAVSMAHLSGALAERANGGLPAGLWLDEMDREEPESRESFWHAFPNHLDGAAIAGCVTMLCFLLT
ncbi:hypothetical protein D9623_09975 [Azospirillum brasilense]|uniref:Uncharacterized protein n=1 Tax=Azospirillum brasilense TaxID=192 RepID=A0A0P0ECR7_AZOBR|nr:MULTISPECIES: hypothetical protein [Azospirillum]ALJ35449.1 hypothetical protein AMK58_08455 [Azospirillum brasilense]MDW7556790.1 hypothetical protein [Azospirillum brasilense]MDW7596559.1 hypothetical protein [Azospirillum brasilense]MDW7631440.1 hypothetical protein [Azospirillum brasilense]MDX5954176.1 hypothetical protein [Azospirillum brasilense]